MEHLCRMRCVFDLFVKSYDHERNLIGMTSLPMIRCWNNEQFQVVFCILSVNDSRVFQTVYLECDA